MYLKYFILFCIFLNIIKCDLIYPKTCGLKFTNKIVGGSESIPNSWPWTVSIHKNFQHVCAGTLINSQWVLTAAHCFVNNVTSAYKVLLGAHDITNVGIKTDAVRMHVADIIQHEMYDYRYSYDIALMKLTSPVDFTTKIFPACMPASQNNYENMSCYFNGWGHTFANGFTQMTLREVSLKILSQKECKIYAQPNEEQKYCSLKEANSNQDTCQGDSGGGMFCKNEDDKWYVGGIVSYGRDNCVGVGLNTRVDYFRKWIDYTILNNS